MTEQFNLLKGNKKTKKDMSSRSFLQRASTPLNVTNSGRLSSIPNLRLQKVTSNSLETLSFISEKDSCKNSDFDNYVLEYNMYLLRKVQNSLLLNNKQDKEDNVKKCFISLKWELEELVTKFVKLSKDLGYFKLFFESLRESNQKIEIGRKILGVLKENKIEIILRALSNALDHKINQLQLIDVNRSLVDEVFSKNVWGDGSEIDECLKKIDDCAKKNKDEVSKIAKELVKIKELCVENSALRERYYCIFEATAKEILETNYEVFTSMVKKAFEKRTELYKGGFPSHHEQFDIQEFLQSERVLTQPTNLQLSKIESPCSVKPNSASTPQPD